LSQERIAVDVAERFNLVENGGFEAGDAIPAWWGRHPGKNTGRNQHARDTSVFRSGKASARIRWVDPVQGPNKAGLQWNKYTVPVEGGTELILSAFVRTAGAKTSKIGTHFYDADKKHLHFASVAGPVRADDWTRVTSTIPVPPKAALMGVALYAGNGGTTWFDDVALLGTPTTTAVRGTPRVDGNLDDACWAPDRAITSFVHHKGTGPGVEKTRAWIAYEDASLYVAFECPHPADAALKEDATGRDGDTWRDDSVEVFLDPGHDHRDYYQFAVNCRGVVRDSHGRDVSWDSATRAGVGRRDGAWTIEIAIPFRDLALDLETGTTWGINLVRNDRARGETVTWSLGGFHNAKRFGNVSLDPDLSACLVPVLAKEVDRLDSDRNALQDEIQGASLSRHLAPRAFTLLDEVQDQVIQLRRMLSSTESISRTATGEMRGRVKAAAKALADARVAAIGAAFAVDGPEVDGGFRVAVASSLRKIRRAGPVSEGIITNRVRLAAARDETESFQLVVIPIRQPLKDVTVQAGPLTGPGGSLAVEWNPVAYVETGKPRAYTPEYVGWWPDVLMPAGPLDVAVGRRQPLWCKVTVPPDAKPGTYTGGVTVRHGRHAVSVPVELRVRDFHLPRPGSLATAFGLYAFALSNWYHGNKPYASVMPPETFARWCEFMGRYRLTPKNIARDYARRVREGDGKRLDLSLVKQTLGPLAAKYYAPYSFCVHRLPCPRDAQDGTTKVDPAVWIRELQARADEYLRLGLPREAYVYGIDEASPKGYPFLKKVYRMVREATPDFPIMQTVNHDPPRELVGLVDIWCPLSSRISEDFYAERKRAGDTLWTYICCSPKPPYASFFVDVPAVDHRVLFWQARQAGATGVLYWCVCWWKGIPGPPSGDPHFPERPIVLKDQSDSLTKLGVNGDGILIWPGPDMTPYPSLRLEVVRDGIEDYEYLSLLQRCVETAKSLPEDRRPDGELLAEAEVLCQVPREISYSFTEYTKDPEVLLTRRAAVGDMIERLVKLLGAQPPVEKSQ